MSRLHDTSRASATDRLDHGTQPVRDRTVPVQFDPGGAEQPAGTAMRSTGPGALQVGMQLVGSSPLVQDGREAVMGAGDIVRHDSPRPFSLVRDATG